MIIEQMFIPKLRDHLQRDERELTRFYYLITRALIRSLHCRDAGILLQFWNISSSVDLNVDCKRENPVKKLFLHPSLHCIYFLGLYAILILLNMS
jgi:hypothetical protein